MNWNNRYYKIAVYGAATTFLLQLISMFVVDPYFAAVLSPFYSVWIIVFIVGWRKEHPRH
ncbi:hypothetical protein [Pontibacter sp. H249]|uniref:hypothetical protein n=1 Tax=Pontibacter sp. H249 TaxID=3133420 RepID=UPI0030BCD4EA